MGNTLQQFRSKLRLDLKDSGALWSDSELNRCVERAVEDLSRFLPLELVHDETFTYDIDDESITTPATASATTIVSGSVISATVDGDVLAIADATPDVPRRLTVTLTDANASVSSLTLLIKGYDQDGNYIEESWYLKDLLVSGTAYQGNLYFKRVTEVEVENIAGGGTGDVISVGTGNAYDSYVFLASRSIRPESELVTNAAGTTEYTRNTDYTMDYANGAIKFINGGDMVAGTAYLIDYDKSRLGINISSLLSVVTRIGKVQYPADLVPQQFVSFNIVGDFMYIGSQMIGESQKNLSANEHIHIYYERKQMPPGEDSPGSYPSILDEVIFTGAGAYALLMMALKYEHQAVTDIAYVDDALDKVALEMTALDGELTAAAGVWTDELTAIQLVDSTLDDGVSSLSDGVSFINKVNVGDNVPELYRDYANVSAALAERYYLVARAWEQKRADLLTEAARYVDKADAWNGEAQNRITNAGLYLEIATRWRQEGLERRNEFWSILRDKSEYRKRISSTPVRQPA